MPAAEDDDADVEEDVVVTFEGVAVGTECNNPRPPKAPPDKVGPRPRE